MKKILLALSTFSLTAFAAWDASFPGAGRWDASELTFSCGGYQNMRCNGARFEIQSTPNDPNTAYVSYDTGNCEASNMDTTRASGGFYISRKGADILAPDQSVIGKVEPFGFDYRQSRDNVGHDVSLDPKCNGCNGGSRAWLSIDFSSTSMGGSRPYACTVSQYVYPPQH